MTVVPQKIDNLIDGELYVWEGIQEDSSGEFLSIRGNNDLTVWVVGDDGGGVVTIEGSPTKESATSIVLSDISGNELSFLAHGVKGIGPAVPFVRPVVTGGLDASVDVYLFIIRKGR